MIPGDAEADEPLLGAERQLWLTVVEADGHVELLQHAVAAFDDRDLPLFAARVGTDRGRPFAHVAGHVPRATGADVAGHIALFAPQRETIFLSAVVDVARPIFA